MVQSLKFPSLSDPAVAQTPPGRHCTIPGGGEDGDGDGDGEDGDGDRDGGEDGDGDGDVGKLAGKALRVCDILPILLLSYQIQIHNQPTTVKLIKASHQDTIPITIRNRFGPKHPFIMTHQV